MTEAIAQKFIFNDKFYEVKEFDKLYKSINPSIYEVIRVDNGVPLFLEDHFSRLKASSEIIGYKLNLSLEQITNYLTALITENNVTNCNVKIVINAFENPPLNIYMYFVESNYPQGTLYNEGISTITYKAVRENPNAKVIYEDMKKSINLKLQQFNHYEALLLNTDNNVTEGSRSNLFFIKDDTVYTPPKNEVLIGITRTKIIELLKRNDIKINEVSISVSELNTYNACFISGTSPKVLPIRRIDDLEYNTKNSLLIRIINLYDEEIVAYYKTHKI